MLEKVQQAQREHIHKEFVGGKGPAEATPLDLSDCLLASLGVCFTFSHSGLSFEVCCSKGIKAREPKFCKTNSSIAPV